MTKNINLDLEELVDLRMALGQAIAMAEYQLGHDQELTDEGRGYVSSMIRDYDQLRQKLINCLR